MKDNLVLDLDCSKIPQVTGDQGGKPQLQFYDWYYHPLITARQGHPISKNLDLINMYFPSTIDTVRTDESLRKSIILSSSDKSRFQMFPMRLNFEVLKFDPDPDKFDKGAQALSILVEGNFKSNFSNRVTEDMKTMLAQIGSEFRDRSEKTSQLFVSDGDFIKNYYNPNNQQVSPVGFNIWEEKVYKGNADFLINAIDYMTDDIGLIQSRSKELKLHLLNTTKAKEEKTRWQLINVVLPLLLLLLFGLFYAYIRKKKYS